MSNKSVTLHLLFQLLTSAFLMNHPSARLGELLLTKNQMYLKTIKIPLFPVELEGISSAHANGLVVSLRDCPK